MVQPTDVENVVDERDDAGAQGSCGESCLVMELAPTAGENSDDRAMAEAETPTAVEEEDDREPEAPMASTTAVEEGEREPEVPGLSSVSRSRWKCDACGNTLKSQRYLFDHVKRGYCAQRLPEAYQCKRCGQTGNKNWAEGHIAKKHHALWAKDFKTPD